MLFVVCWLLFIGVCCSLLVVWWSVFEVRCLSFGVCFLFGVSCLMLFVV